MGPQGGSPPPLRMPVFLFVAVVARICATPLVRAQSQEGFISIDCGIADGAGYRDNSSTLEYVPDTDYIDTGVSRNILDSNGNYYMLYQTLRSFPEGIRNCYKLRPLRPGRRYLVRALFNYGNYDGEDKVPVFDLYIGVKFWATVEDDNQEIIVVAPTNSLSVCLVNTGKGTPFISGLELRPLSDSMYLLANQSQSLVLLRNRRNYGETSQMRYPEDPYDRIWFPRDGFGRKLYTSQEVSSKTGGDQFEVPSSVLRTAVEMPDTSYRFFTNFTPANGMAGDTAYAVMHFAEIRRLMWNESRTMDIYGGETISDHLLYANYSASYLEADAQVAIGEGETYIVSIEASSSATLPPAINALEYYVLRPMDVLPTDDGDVEAMEEVRAFYRLMTTKTNWRGDPCAPAQFRWDGVTCDYRDSVRPPRVVGLNLSWSGLSGGVSASLANLTALETLDLSNNNLTGAIPDFLSELPSLTLLVLTGNQQLSGRIPSALCEKKRSDELLIRVEGNPSRCAQTTKKKGSLIRVVLVVVIAGVSILLLLLLLNCIVFWRCRNRRRQSVVPEGLHTMQQKEAIEMIQMNMSPKSSHQCTFTEIKEITNNFKNTIGRGGSGTVYLGKLSIGSSVSKQVAVKVLSGLSSQGLKQFRAEAILLRRVHHKNLVALLGYCHDENNLALMYEYMDMGSLHDHLSGDSGDLYVLTWEQRIKIAFQAAQGLDYLHNGCEPPIIHRDVKSSNILVKHDLTAKLADFGLSRAFNEESKIPISTVVAGTPGYLDPEYCQTYELNERSDVYSFGIVLLELLTGQPVISSWPVRRHITQWVQSRLESGGGIDSIVDARLCGHYGVHSVRKILEIATTCTAMPSELRLTMSSVVSKLKECYEMEVTAGDAVDDSVAENRTVSFLSE